MRKLRILAFAAVTFLGCDDDDDFLDDDFDDADGDGIPDDIDDDDGTPAMLAWTATLAPNVGYSGLTGTATVRQDVGAQSFDASASIRGDTPGAVRPWHVHFGNCATGGDIVGGDLTYPRLIVDASGAADASVTIPVALDPVAQYHVNVHLSDAQLGTIIACGDLIRSQP